MESEGNDVTHTDRRGRGQCNGRPGLHRDVARPHPEQIRQSGTSIKMLGMFFLFTFLMCLVIITFFQSSVESILCAANLAQPNTRSHRNPLRVDGSEPFCVDGLCHRITRHRRCFQLHQGFLHFLFLDILSVAKENVFSAVLSFSKLKSDKSQYKMEDI